MFYRKLFLLIGAFLLLSGRVYPEGNTVTLDMRGKTVTPYIVYNAAVKMKAMEAGEKIEITTDEFEEITSDLSAWCRMSGNVLVSSDKGSNTHRYVIQKGPEKKQKKKMVMVISEKDLGHLLSPLGLALAVSLSGGEVNIFFQGEAVAVLEKGFKESLTGFSYFFSPLARNGLAKIGHVSAQEKVRMIHELGGKIFICGPSMDNFGVKREDLILSDIQRIEYFSVYEMMLGSDTSIFLQ
jgi:predicted peroxiredoxin/TusA-related sulfurtransferase